MRARIVGKYNWIAIRELSEHRLNYRLPSEYNIKKLRSVASSDEVQEWTPQRTANRKLLANLWRSVGWSLTNNKRPARGPPRAREKERNNSANSISSLLNSHWAWLDHHLLAKIGVQVVMQLSPNKRTIQQPINSTPKQKEMDNFSRTLPGSTATLQVTLITKGRAAEDPSSAREKELHSQTPQQNQFLEPSAVWLLIDSLWMLI